MRVWIGHVPLLLYESDAPLTSSNNTRIDHIAVTCDDFDRAVAHLRDRGVHVEVAVQGGTTLARFEGPDEAVIELVAQR
jgi:4-hydroxyphenylpyruvate dioxygenase-like putative hemolysin